MEVQEMSSYPQKMIFDLELYKSRGGINILDQGLADFFLSRTR